MKASEVKLGGIYAAKVSDKVAPVQLISESLHGGWNAKNLTTGKVIRVKSAQRLRYACDENGAPLATRPVAAQDEKKAEPKAKRTKTEKSAPGAPTGAHERTSGLDAAAEVLREADQPLGAKEIVERMLAQGLWTTGGKTPAATIYAAMIREIAAKGAGSRFQKVERGRFTVTGGGK